MTHPTAVLWSSIGQYQDVLLERSEEGIARIMTDDGLPVMDDDVMAAVKVLYVRNLMLTTTEDKIRAEFEKIKEGSVERVKKMKDFAFVHFKEREDALKAMNIMNGA